MFDLSLFVVVRERVLLIKTFRAPFRGDLFQRKGMSRDQGVRNRRLHSAKKRIFTSSFCMESHHSIKKSEKNAKHITTKIKEAPHLPSSCL